MASENQIRFSVGFDVDKSGLNEIQNSLKQIQDEFNLLGSASSLSDEFTKAKEAASQLSVWLNQSWDDKLGQLNLTKFNESVTTSYGSVSNLKKVLEGAGTSGADAYNKLASSILSTNLQINQSSKFLDSMAKTMGNTVKWGIASSAMNSLSGAVQSAWSYVKKLDTSLNDIRIVTGKSADDMAAFAESANTAAKSLGASTTDFTNASLIYYQQGLSDTESAERAEVTLKAANVTGQAASEVSEQLTAVWNGFNVNTENAEQAVDVLAAVAASTASDLEELSTGMSKVASAASAMGVGEEQLAAQLSTIISVTRQAPESVGTALKTIYARMSDIEAGVDEEGATLGSYTSEMANMGINVLDATGSLRDMGDVIEEIGGKWSSFSREQQVALAQTMAGTRQYNNLIALFDNWDDYTDALNVANNATGTLQEQQDIYMESTEAHLQQLSTTLEETWSTLVDTEAINTIIDAISDVVSVFNSFLKSLGGGMSTLTQLGVLATNVFRKQIGNSIENVITKRQTNKSNEQALNVVQETAEAGASSYGADSQERKAYEGQVARAKELLSVVKDLDSEEYNRLNNLNSEITQLDLVIAKYEQLHETKEAKKESLENASNKIEDIPVGGEDSDPIKALQDVVETNSVDFNVVEEYTKALKESSSEEEALNSVKKALKEALEKQVKENKKDYINDLKSNTSGEENQEQFSNFKNVERIQSDLEGMGSKTKILTEEYMETYTKLVFATEEETAKLKERLAEIVNEQLERILNEQPDIKKEEELKKAEVDIDDIRPNNGYTDIQNFADENEIQFNAYEEYKKNYEETQDVDKALIKTKEALKAVIEKQIKEIDEDIKKLAQQEYDKAKENLETEKNKKSTLDKIDLQSLKDKNSLQAAQGQLKANGIDLNIVEIYEESMQKGNSEEEALNKVREALNQALKAQVEAVDKATQEEKDTAANLQAASTTPEENSKNIDKRNSNENRYYGGGMGSNGEYEQGVNQKQRAQAISNTIQGVTGLITSFTTLGNLVSIFDDDSLSGWEKFSQIASNLMFTLPMMISSFSSIATLMPSLAMSMGIAGITAETSFTDATIAVLGFETALGPLWAVILAITAAVAVIGVAAKSIYDSYTSASRAAEAAAESAQALKEANDAVVESYSNLQSAIETYESAKDQLDECTEGTEEWQEALEETNSAAAELLETVSDLDGIDLVALENEYGSLYDKETGEINEDILNAVEQEQSLTATESSLASAFANINEAEKTAYSDLTNAVRSDLSGYDNEVIEEIWNNRDDYTGLTDEEFSEKLADTFPFIEDFIKNVDDLNDAVNSVVSDLNNSTITSNATIDSEIQSALSSLGIDDDAVAQAVSNQILNQEEDIEEDKFNELNNISRYTDEDDIEYINLIEQLEKFGFSAAEGNVVQGGENERTFLVTDSEGNEKTLTQEDVAAYLATSEALEGLETSAEDAALGLTNLVDNLPEGLGEAFKDYLTDGNFESLTQEEFNTLLNELGGSLTEESLVSYLMKETGLDKDTIEQQYSTDEMVDKLLNISTAFDTYLDNYLSTTQDAFNNLDINQEDLSVKAGTAIGDALEGAIIYGTEETVDSISSFIDALDEDEVNDFGEAISGVDWSIQTVSTFSDLLDEAGISTKYTTEELSDFIYRMKEAENQTARTFDDLAEEYSSTHEIIDDLSNGETITEENYQALKEINSNISQFFVKTLSGTYKLVGAANDLQDAVQSSLLEEQKRLIEQTTESIDAYQKVASDENTENLLKTDLSTSYEEAYKASVREAISKENEFGQEVVDKILDLAAGSAGESISDEDLLTFNAEMYELTTLLNNNSQEVVSSDSDSGKAKSYNLQAIMADFKELIEENEDVKTFLEQYASAEMSTLTEFESEIVTGDYIVLSPDDADTLEDQLDLLESLGQDDEELLDSVARWRDSLNNGTLNYSDLEDITTEIEKQQDAFDNLDETITEKINELIAQERAILDSAESYDELRELYEDPDYNIEDEVFNQAYLDMWNSERMEDLDSDAVETYTEYLQDLAETSSDLSVYLAENEEAAEDLAIQIMNMTDGVEALADGWEEWSEILSDSTATSEEYSEAISSVKDAMSKLLDIDSAFISNNLILSNMEDISAAAEGDADAIDRLREAAYQEILVEVGIDDSQLYAGMDYSLSEIQSYLDGLDLKVGATIDGLDGTNDYINSLNSLISATEMTTDQVTAMLGSMGYDVEFDPTTVTYTNTVPITTTTTHREYLDEPDKWGNHTDWEDVTTVSTSSVESSEASTTLPALGITTSDGETSGGDVTISGSTEDYSGETTVTSAQVSSITKKANGSYNNYSSSNAGGSNADGSDDEDEEEPEVLDYLEDERDLYHDINLEIQELSTNLSRLQNQEKKLTGNALVENLNEQLAVLNDQMDAANQKIAIANYEASDLRAQLSAEGVTFDDDGYISNYDSILASKINYVNSCIDQYNNMSAEEQEEYEDTLDDIQEDYEDFVDKISDYDTLISETIPGLEDDIQTALDKEIEIHIEAFTMEVDVSLDMTEARQQWNKFYKEVVLGVDDDDILGNTVADLADMLSYYNTNASSITYTGDTSDWASQISKAINEGGSGSIQETTSVINGILDQINQIETTGWASEYGDDISSAMEDLKEYSDQIMTDLEAIEDYADTIKESYIKAIEEVNTAYENTNKQYDFLTDQLEHDIKLIELLDGENAYSEKANYYGQLNENYLSELSYNRQRADYAEAQLQQAQADLAKARKSGDEEQVAYYEELVNTWAESWEDAISDVNSTLEDALDNILDMYTNTIEEIMSNLQSAMTDGLSFDYADEEWELMKEYDELYLDEVNAAYEKTSLKQKYIEAINDTDSVTAQKKLNDLMEEQLGYLEDKENITEYDVERAEKLLEIELAQIALEEAQQNKSTLRLRRDSQGNYSYEYVADADEIAEAQQKLLDLQNELYNFDKDQYMSNLEQMYDLQVEYAEKLEELANDTTLSAEEKEAKKALYAEQYGKLIEGYYNETAATEVNVQESAAASLKESYDASAGDFGAMTDAEIEDLLGSDGLVFNWDSAYQQMDKSAEDNLALIQQAAADLDAAYAEYQENQNEACEQAGINAEEVKAGIDSDTEATQSLIEETQTQTDETLNQASAVGELVAQMQELMAAYSDVQDAAVEAATAANTAWQEFNSQLEANVTKFGEVETAAYNAAAAIEQYNAAAGSSSGSSGSSGGSSGSNDGDSTSGSSSSDGDSSDSSDLTAEALFWLKGRTAESFAKIKTPFYHDTATSYKGFNEGKDKGLKREITKVGKASDPYPFYVMDRGWVSLSQIDFVDSEKFDTGGYTGDWDGSDGALAFLHQKELVLNSDDTENILNAVGMVRDISSLLANLDTSAFEQMFSYINGLSFDSNNYERGSDTLEQDVHIEASFPNVTSSNEIEEAFNNLVNVASMYANRKTR